ncbi:hypothetical protein SAMN05216436_1522 [bacterium A37T11]|nr:hypothetical protein SAMN05216436_1522 [bacterium A37T11]
MQFSNILKISIPIILSIVSVSSYAQDSVKMENYIRDFQYKITSRGEGGFFRNTGMLKNDTSTIYSFVVKVKVQKLDSIRSKVLSVSANDSIVHEFFKDLNVFKRFSYVPLLGNKRTATVIIPFFIVYYFGPNRGDANYLYPLNPGGIDQKMLKLFGVKDFSSPESIGYTYLPPICVFMRGE